MSSTIEVRDSPHGIFASCTRYSRGLTRWAELLGRQRRRRRRRQLVSRGISTSGPPPCLFSKGAGHQNAWSHTRMLSPSVILCLSSKRTDHQNVRSHIRMLGPSVSPDSPVITECLVLQYSQIHESYQNAWSFSISRFTGHTRMLGPLMPKV